MSAIDVLTKLEGYTLRIKDVEYQVYRDRSKDQYIIFDGKRQKLEGRGWVNTDKGARYPEDIGL